MIPMTQNDNDNMIRLMIDIEIKLTKNAKKMKKIKTSLKQERIIHNKIKNILDSKKNSSVVVHESHSKESKKIMFQKLRNTRTT